jgi:hypothetical protein
LGESGAKFLSQLQETQMFCNYCHNEAMKKAEPPSFEDKIAQKNANLPKSRDKLGQHLSTTEVADIITDAPSTLYARSGTTDGRTADANATEKDCGIIVSSFGGRLDNYRENSSSHSIDGNVLRKKYDDPTETEEYKTNDDPLVLLFKIMLTGTTIPPRRYDDALLLNSCGTIAYNNSCGSQGFIPQRSEVSDIDSSNPWRLTDQRHPHLLSADQTVWCNGCCGGSADSPLCTSICLQLWEKRVRDVRYKLYIKGVIERQHHSKIVRNSALSSCGQAIPIISRVPSVKHPRETDTQFQKRVEDILARGQGIPPFGPVNLPVVRSQSSTQPKFVGVKATCSNEEKQYKPHEMNNQLQQEMRRDFPSLESVSKSN